MRIIKNLIKILEKADVFFDKVHSKVNDCYVKKTLGKSLDDKEKTVSEKTKLKQKFETLISEIQGYNKDLARRLSKKRLRIRNIKPEYSVNFGGFVDQKIKSVAEAAAYFGHGAKAEDVELTHIEFTETVNEIIFCLSGTYRLVYHNHLMFVASGLSSSYKLAKNCYYADVYAALKACAEDHCLEYWKENLTVLSGSVNLEYFVMVWKYGEDFITTNWQVCFCGKINNVSKPERYGSRYFIFEKMKPQFYNRQAAIAFFSKKLGVNIDENDVYLGTVDLKYMWFYQNYFLSVEPWFQVDFVWGIYDSKLVSEAMAKEPSNHFFEVKYQLNYEADKRFQISFYYVNKGRRNLVVYVKNGEIYPKYLAEDLCLYKIYDKDVSFETVNKDMNDPAVWKQYLTSFPSYAELP